MYVGMKAIADVLQRHGLPLGSALLIGTQFVWRSISNDWRWLLLARAPLEYGLNRWSLVFDFITPQCDVTGMAQNLDLGYLPAELLRLAVDGIIDAARSGWCDDWIAEALNLEFGTGEACEFSPHF